MNYSAALHSNHSAKGGRGRVCRRRALEMAASCQRVLVRAKNSIEFLQDICEEITGSGGYAMAWIGLAIDDKDFSIRPLASAGSIEGYLDSVRRSWGHKSMDVAPAGKAIQNGRPYVIQDILTDERRLSWRGQALKRNYSSVLSLPLFNLKKPFGALTLFAYEPDAFPEKEVEYLNVLAESVGYGILAIENRNIRYKVELELESNIQKLQKTLGAIIQAFERTIEIRDPYTAEHQRRVADLACATAMEMGLSKDRIDGIRIAGIIHDIGKICIPAEILSRPRQLTEMEFNLVKSHPQFGFDVLKAIEFRRPVQSFILQHHERLDGSGYPYHLREAEILVESRILGVADVVEAMSSHRPYRPALGVTAALKEIRQNAGILFDPFVVESCVSIFEEGRFDFSEKTCWSESP
ncbi:MAG: GAF domain-containing protein, partial [Candidatus Aminicenantes bacterium]|nr:GAF domain-containing protein [Candidatus Aminicenantes bacterium]